MHNDNDVDIDGGGGGCDGKTVNDDVFGLLLWLLMWSVPDEFGALIIMIGGKIDDDSSDDVG